MLNNNWERNAYTFDLEHKKSAHAKLSMMAAAGTKETSRILLNGPVN